MFFFEGKRHYFPLTIKYFQVKYYTFCYLYFVNVICFCTLLM